MRMCLHDVKKRSLYDSFEGGEMCGHVWSLSIHSS